MAASSNLISNINTNLIPEAQVYRISFIKKIFAGKFFVI